MSPHELQQRLAARGIQWEPPERNVPIAEYIERYIDAVLLLFDQIERDYPKK